MSPVKRLHYFDYQLLRARDFAEEQAYHREMLRRHNAGLHDWGVGRGLSITAAGSGVRIEPGVAIDPDGGLLVLERDLELDLAKHPDGAPVWLVIRPEER